MAGRPSKNREIVYSLIQDGKSTFCIRELTGLSRSTVNKYRLELANAGKVREKDHINVRPGFWTEWTVAVNRIRQYMGKEPFPLPEE